MAAQFFSALADNALLIAAIAILRALQLPGSWEPLLKSGFTLSYVVLAAFVGAFADSMPKGRVMFIANALKILGCALMFINVNPLLAYAVVGLGAATYSPAKYGILTELLPHDKLVIANGWIEGLTVVAIILGVAIGGLIIHPHIANTLLSFDFPFIDTGINTVPKMNLTIIGAIYLVAALFNLYIPDTGVDHKPLKRNPLYLLHEFSHCFKLLWRDRLGQISLAVTTLFWGAGATLQFIVIDWAGSRLALSLSSASLLQGIVAIGVALGAALAARLVVMRRAVAVLPLGVIMGLGVILMNLVTSLTLAVPLLLIVGVISGFFVVPMNALLQQRGHVLMGAGHSIAVQNFNENLAILLMTTGYALLIKSGLPIAVVITLFGLFIAIIMLLIMRRYRSSRLTGALIEPDPHAH